MTDHKKLIEEARGEVCRKRYTAKEAKALALELADALEAATTEHVWGIRRKDGKVIEEPWLNPNEPHRVMGRSEAEAFAAPVQVDEARLTGMILGRTAPAAARAIAEWLRGGGR